MSFNLPEVPDLSAINDYTTTSSGSSSEPILDGWYQGTFVAKREFTDRNGNDRIFESADAVSQKGDSRNIRLQVELTRRSDGKVINLSTTVNYKPEDLTAETVATITAAVKAQKETGEQYGADLFRTFMSLQRLGKLQTIAGVRQFQRTDEGGLDVSPVYGKTAYFRLTQDSRNPLYKEVKDFQAKEPTKVAVQ